MNETMRESLSALLDDEANELELERMLSQASTNAAMRDQWMRYALAQQALHGQQPVNPHWDISSRVQAALGSTQTSDTSRAIVLKQRLLRPLASLAVAASVTLTVVIGAQQLTQLDAGTPHSRDSQPVAASASPVGLLNSLGATTVQASYGTQGIPSLQPASRSAYQDLARQRHRRFIQEHAEQAALNTPQGLVPFARVPEIRQ